MKLPVVNHQDYVAKINDDNKFPIRKFGELANYLINQKIVERFYKPDYCSEETLSRAHSLEYIASIKKKTIDTKSQKKIGFPINDSVVNRSFRATGGTVLASKLAIDHRIACNTAGGSHHATYNEGAGYCVFNDVAVATRYLQSKGYVKNVLNKNLKELNYNTYDFVFYVAGVDIHLNDRLGKLKISEDGIKRRDEMIINNFFEKNVPICGVLGGGYNKDFETLVRLHAILHKTCASVI